MIMMANGFRRCTGNAAKGNLTKTALSRADAANRNLTRTALSRANAAKGNLTRTAFSRADAAKGNLRLAPGTAVPFLSTARLASVKCARNHNAFIYWFDWIRDWIRDWRWNMVNEGFD